MLNVYKRTLELVKREVKQCYCVCVKVCLCLTAPAQVKKQLEDAICAVKSPSELFYAGSLTQTTTPLKWLMKLNMEFGPVNIWKPAWTNVLAALFSSVWITFHSYNQKQGCYFISCCFHITRVMLTDIFSTDSGRFTLLLLQTCIILWACLCDRQQCLKSFFFFEHY